MSTPLDLVVAWHDAAKEKDTEAPVTLVHPDVELHGPKGSRAASTCPSTRCRTPGIGLEFESCPHDHERLRCSPAQP